MLALHVIIVHVLIIVYRQYLSSNCFPIIFQQFSRFHLQTRQRVMKVALFVVFHILLSSKLSGILFIINREGFFFTKGVFSTFNLSISLKQKARLLKFNLKTICNGYQSHFLTFRCLFKKDYTYVQCNEHERPRRRTRERSCFLWAHYIE